MSELVFEVVQEVDGGYSAECLKEIIFMEGATWDELRKNALEAWCLLLRPPTARENSPPPCPRRDLPAA